MLNQVNLINVLVLDIETVSNKKNYQDMRPEMQKLWDIKSKQIQSRIPEEEKKTPSESYEESAGIYAEFGKIVCISVGVFRKNSEGELNFYLKSYYNHDERKLLIEFSDLLKNHYNNTKTHYICGHNIKEFDIPYTCRRMVVNGLELPEPLNIPGKKPWELSHLLDTMTLWKFGDYKNYTALKLLCGLFNIPTPKDDIDGSEVGKTYWKEDDLERIQNYCKKDVLATARLLMSYKCMSPIEEEMVHF
ncbi:MAG: ribonuclease H-like domain-containing protein [Saprospiraceae bacterium]|nr:ribonuclease H-like domain-containing protein [Saprospiraceae bacterium]